MTKNLKGDKMRLIRKFLFLCVAIFLTLSLSGCGPSKDTTGSSIGLSDTASSGLAFPVNAEQDKTVTIQFKHKSGDSSKDKKVTYIRIQTEDPISKGKIGEGEASPNSEDRIRPYNTKYNEDFDTSIAEGGDGYTEPVRILRKNFREIQIATEPKENPAEVVFLQVKDPTTIGPEMDFFDVYLAQDKSDLIDSPTDRGWSAQLSLAQVLTDCGQLQASNNPDQIAETIQLGQGGLSEDSAQAQKLKDFPPDELGPVGSDSQSIVKLKVKNPGNDPLIDKLFAAGANNPFLADFRKIGNEQAQNHTAFSKQLSLTPELLGVKAGQFFADASFTLIISQDESGNNSSPVLQVTKGGQNYLYAPQIATKIFQAPPTTSGQNIGVTNATPESVPISSDPWCGFTPESKPAIYLYPKTLTRVKVKLNPSGGWVTTSNPPYPKTGWDVWALPNGTIIKDFKIYSHLFYEAMLPTPQMGKNYEVLDTNNLQNELKSLAHKLSLNTKESNELASYWQAKLKGAPYYQVGLMDADKVEKSEPLEISPNPDSIYRLRLIFKPLQQKTLATGIPDYHFERKGFSAVEWGGYVLN